MKAFMFPGQGAQARGMGGGLFDEFAELTRKADQVLGYSIRELCLQDPRRELSKTQFTQPALYVVNALSYYKKVNEGAQQPDYLLGHSLGEFNALLAAQCFDFETGLRLVQKRGELMSQESSGAMAAILNASRQQIETILNTHGLGNVDLANYNTPSQIVISGSSEEVGKAQQYFQSGEMLYYPLNTSGAFHSRFMRGAQEKFHAFLKGFEFAAPKIPVLANATARPYEHGEIIATLASQMSNTVRWCESVQYLLEQAAGRGDAIQFEEVGYGDVLTKIVHTIRQQTPAPQVRAVENRPEPSLPVKKLTAAERVSAWNGKYPVGTRVKSLTRSYDSLETRTPAVVLFGHRAALYMKGYNGYFDMDEVAPL